MYFQVKIILKSNHYHTYNYYYTLKNKYYIKKYNLHIFSWRFYCHVA
jgi:hypothetical protein